jgi:hypothetical protein
LTYAFRTNAATAAIALALSAAVPFAGTAGAATSRMPDARRIGTVAVAAAVVAVAATAPGPKAPGLRPKVMTAAKPAPAPAPAPVPAITRPFSPDSFWNRPLADDAPIDPMSAAYSADLRRQLGQWMPWINTTRYSSPVYTVPASQPTVRVKLDNVQKDLQAAWERVPIPADARPAAGTDGTMVVWQPSTDTMWEFWQAQKRGDGWHARYGGKMSSVSTNPGYYVDQPRWGATATSLPFLGGLIRISELRAGHIDHALAIAIPQPKAGVVSWPAQRGDGNYGGPSAIPEGTRFRIDPKLDLRTIPMSPIVRQIAVAAQRYGMVVRDKGGAVAFYAEDPTPTGTDPFGGPAGFFGGRYPSQLLAQFPWQRLQALQTSISTAPR